MKALVVDDARMIRKMLRQILTSIGFDVQEAENGQQGLEVLQQMDSVDVILADWNMPEMDGIQFVRTIRSDPRYVDQRIVMVTSQAEMDHLQIAFDAGVSEYIMKPFTPEMIREKLCMVGFALS